MLKQPNGQAAAPPAPRQESIQRQGRRCARAGLEARTRLWDAARLFDEPLPPFVEPCLATLRDTVPAGEKWVHEIKWDGYRLKVRIEDGKVTILTRRGHDWTDRFPAIRDAAKALPVRMALIDGEAVVEVDGIASFSALQAAWARARPGHKAAHEAVFYAFDLLHLNGVDIQPATLLKRKQALVGTRRRRGRDPLFRAPHRGWRRPFSASVPDGP